jgi:hypothetical protein
MNIKNVLKMILVSLKGRHRNVINDKKELIDNTFRRCNPVPSSFADLGGIWNVDGGYTFYTLGKYKASHAILADTEITESVFQKSSLNNNLKLIQGNFGEPAVAERIGKVDAIFLFDVLLHQVKPDWNEILKMYAERTSYFVVYNPQWIGSGETVRLIDLGKDEYFRNVPHAKDAPLYRMFYEKMFEINPRHNRIWRDVHNVWQWGITDRDLTGEMENLGFKMKWFRNCGQFGHLPNFENHAFIFQRS